MPEAHYHMLDVFTNSKFGGNPLAIFEDAHSIEEYYLQKIASELNLSETVFLYPPKQSDSWKMRIFTPGGELDTAGHPTVGTAFHLASQTNHTSQERSTMTLYQNIGPINVQIDYINQALNMVTMFQPLPVFGPIYSEKQHQIADLLSLHPDDIDAFPIQEVSCGNNTLLIPLKNIESLKKIVFKQSKLQELGSSINSALIYPFTVNGVINGQVQGRMFAPHLGIHEDPATGSANGPLAAYLSKYDVLPMPLISLQGVEMGRPSKMHLDIEKDSNGNITAVKVGGHCVYVGKGSIYLD